MAGLGTHSIFHRELESKMIPLKNRFFFLLQPLANMNYMIKYIALMHNKRLKTKAMTVNTDNQSEPRSIYYSTVFRQLSKIFFIDPVLCVQMVVAMYL